MFEGGHMQMRQLVSCDLNCKKQNCFVLTDKSSVRSLTFSCAALSSLEQPKELPNGNIIKYTSRLTKINMSAYINII